jgi:hypothetical protein
MAKLAGVCHEWRRSSRSGQWAWDGKLGRQACAFGASTDDPDRIALWRLETAFHTPQER